MQQHLAGATIQIANLVVYNCHTQEDGNYLRVSYCNKIIFIILGLLPRKPVFGANNKGADKPAHRHSLISAFVIGLLEILYIDLLQAELQFSS